MVSCYNDLFIYNSIGGKFELFKGGNWRNVGQHVAEKVRAHLFRHLSYTGRLQRDLFAIDEHPIPPGRASLLTLYGPHRRRLPALHGRGSRRIYARFKASAALFSRIPKPKAELL